MRRWNGWCASGKPWTLPMRSRMYPLALQQPPAHKEQQQHMLHHRKSHIGIRDYAPYGGEWEGEQVIICPLPMGQEINDAMGEHADKERECRSVEHSRQGEAWTDHHK